jgi:hypothetical protein
MWSEDEDGNSEGGHLDNDSLLQRKQLLHKFLQACIRQLQHLSRAKCEAVLEFLQDPSAYGEEQVSGLLIDSSEEQVSGLLIDSSEE